jgi:hypothetical protein
MRRRGSTVLETRVVPDPSLPDPSSALKHFERRELCVGWYVSRDLQSLAES